MLKIRNTEKYFGTQRVLGGVSIDIQKQEIFGLLGPSGAGKTTLINILTNQLQADVGDAYIEADPFEVGLMLDEDGLYPRLSCQENMNLFARIYGISTDKSLEALEKVGLGSATKKMVSTLSKGMRQRLALARSVLHKPKVILLDEPTSGLDPGTAQGIHRLILDLRDNGATVFLTTHNMDEAVRLCDRVALLHRGQIVESGSPLEICERHHAIRTTPDLGAVFLKMTGVDLL